MVYTAYGLVIFSLLFALFLPLLAIPMIFPSQYKWIGIANRWWARLLFTFIGIPFKNEYRGSMKNHQPYVYAANHFSFIDIPVMGLNHYNAIFVGKSELQTIPVFGYMFRKLHITVDRGSLKSRYNTMKQSLEAIDKGKSLTIFAEGGIYIEKDPVLQRFKDGPFRIAIEKQIPLVPVTIPYNWIILPPDKFLLRWHPVKAVYHEPIETVGMTLEDLDELKQRTFNIIHDELQQHLNALK
jgi:1-acyl-sn-glycerol-3-phosphate acyltransferase